MSCRKGRTPSRGAALTLSRHASTQPGTMRAPSWNTLSVPAPGAVVMGPAAQRVGLAWPFTWSGSMTSGVQSATGRVSRWSGHSFARHRVVQQGQFEGRSPRLPLRARLEAIGGTAHQWPCCSVVGHLFDAQQPAGSGCAACGRLGGRLGGGAGTASKHEDRQSQRGGHGADSTRDDAAAS